jgi:hypothetical protein
LRSADYLGVKRHPGITFTAHVSAEPDGPCVSAADDGKRDAR